MTCSKMPLDVESIAKLMKKANAMHWRNRNPKDDF